MLESDDSEGSKLQTLEVEAEAEDRMLIYCMVGWSPCSSNFQAAIDK